MSKKQIEPSNAKAFADAVRSLDCDEPEERFDAALRKIAAEHAGAQRP
jgi:hypothetical protein